MATQRPLSAQQPGLLVDAPPAAVATSAGNTSVGRATTRSRLVTLDLSRLRPASPGQEPPGEVTLNLFPDTGWTATLDRLERSATGSVWVGHIPSVALSTVTLSLVNDTLDGSVFTPGGTYTIRHAGNGLHEVTQVSSSEVADAAAIPEMQRAVVAATDTGTTGATPAPDDGRLIDVMVLYTPAAEAAAGGSAAMAALINNAIALTNASFANSGITPRVRLAAASPVSYSESGSMSTDLNNLTHGSGALSGVAALRDAYHADLVTMLTRDASECGRAWVMLYPFYGFESYAYSVLDQSCAIGQLSFTQVLGANMGARTDWYSEFRYGSGSYTPVYVNPDTALYSGPYAHAYVNPAGRWRSLMATGALCEAYGTSCTLLPY